MATDPSVHNLARWLLSELNGISARKYIRIEKCLVTSKNAFSMPANTKHCRSLKLGGPIRAEHTDMPTRYANCGQIVDWCSLSCWLAMADVCLTPRRRGVSTAGCSGIWVLAAETADVRSDSNKNNKINMCDPTIAPCHAERPGTVGRRAGGANIAPTTGVANRRKQQRRPVTMWGPGPAAPLEQKQCVYTCTQPASTAAA